MKFEVKKETVNKMADYGMLVAGMGAAKTMLDSWKRIGGFNTPLGVVGGFAVAIATGVTGAAGVDYARNVAIKVMDMFEEKEEKTEEPTEENSEEETETA